MKNPQVLNNIKISNPTLSFIVVAILCLGLFQSCSEDNPIIHSNEPVVVDSNLFVWKLDTIQVDPTRYFYVADTNNIFIAGYPYSVHIQNGQIHYINHNDNDFSPYCLNGTSVNNIFIGGLEISTGYSKLKRWNGSTIENIVMPADTTHAIMRIETISDNDIWISTQSNTIYHYVNNSFTSYKLDSSLDQGVIFKDAIGNIYTQFDSYTPGVESEIFSVYKFVNNTWIQMYRDSVTSNSEMDFYIGFSGDKMLRMGKTGIYYFNGIEFLSFLHLGSRYTPFLAGASGPDNILFVAHVDNFDTFIFYYDGKQLFKTPNQYFPSPPNQDMQYKFDRFYFLIDIPWDESCFGTAIFKNNKILK